MAGILGQLADRPDSVYAGEAEKLDLAGSPAEIGRWRRRTTAALIVITAILAVTGLVLGIAMLLDPK